MNLISLTNNQKPRITEITPIEFIKTLQNTLDDQSSFIYYSKLENKLA